MIEMDGMREIYDEEKGGEWWGMMVLRLWLVDMKVKGGVRLRSKYIAKTEIDSLQQGQ